MNRVNFYFEEINDFDVNYAQIEDGIDYLIQNENKELNELSVIFCSDEYLLEKNIEYLNHNTLTDIITFDYTEGIVISGDLFISIERVTYNANKYNINFFNELYRVIFHGVLHLVGYGDKQATEKLVMTGKENFYLDYLYKAIFKDDTKV